MCYVPFVHVPYFIMYILRFNRLNRCEINLHLKAGRRSREPIKWYVSLFFTCEEIDTSNQGTAYHIFFTCKATVIQPSLAEFRFSDCSRCFFKSALRTVFYAKLFTKDDCGTSVQDSVEQKACRKKAQIRKRCHLQELNLRMYIIDTLHQSLPI